MMRRVAHEGVISCRSEIRAKRILGVGRSPSFPWGRPSFGRPPPAARGRGCKIRSKDALNEGESRFCKKRPEAERLFRAGDDPGQLHSDGRNNFLCAIGSRKLEVKRWNTL